MLKVGRKQLHHTYTELWLLPFFSLAVLGVIGLLGGIPVAYAAAKEAKECTGTLNRPAFDSAVVVDNHEVICSNITSFGGNVVIRGMVEGDVVSFASNVVIDGKVNGDVKLYGGNVTLQNGAYVNGDIHLCGGNWVEGSSSQFHGTVIDCPSSLNQFLANNGGPGFHLWSILIWVVLGVLLTSLLPEHVMLVRTTVLVKGRRSLALGLLSILLAPVILVVLTALIISIPLAIIVAIGLIAAWALGVVAVGWLLGEYIVQRIAPQHNTRLLQVAVGLIVLMVVGSLPYIGLFISVGAGLVGLGAVLLSRFGTRLYSPPKQPLTL